MTEVIILAAGKGKRMLRADIPKVMVQLRGKPLIEYVMAAVEESGVCNKPVVVVGYQAEQVQRYLGNRARYAVQDQQLGTGHAVLVAENQMAPATRNVLVLYGDMPLITPQTIRSLLEQHQANARPFTMGTVMVADFNDWRQCFYDYGRVLRGNNNKVLGIIEKKDATPEQLEIKEVSPSYFCFQSDWLWTQLKTLKNNNAQREYYLTDLADVAMALGYDVATVPVAAVEALGVNTADQLSVVENVLQKNA